MTTYVIQSDDCLLWKGKPSAQGYGQVWHEGKQHGAHRVAYMLLVGPIPDGYEVDHTCRVRMCINPAHLEAVTKEVNRQREADANRKPTCPKGHTRFSQRAGRNGRKMRRCLDCHLEREHQRYHSQDRTWT